MPIPYTTQNLANFAAFAAMNAMLFLTAYTLSVTLLPKNRSKSDILLAIFTISAAIIVITETALGAASILTLQNVLIATAIITIITYLTYGKTALKNINKNTAAPNAAISAPNPATGQGDRLSIPAILFLAAAAAVLFLYFIEAAATPPPPTDAFTDHLYFPAVWLQQSKLTLIARAAGDQAVFYYPLNGSLLLLWLMLPFREDTLCNLVQYFSLIACCIAVFSLARKIGVRKNLAAIASTLPVFTPLLILRSTNSDIDILFCAFFLAGLNFAFLYAENNAPQSLALGAAAFGLFAGTKSIAALYLAPVLPVLLWIICAGRGGPRKIASHALIFLIGIIIPCAYWYARNIALTGNPLYPLEIKLLGATILPGAFTRQAMLGSIFHSSSPGELRSVLADWTFGPGLTILAALTAGAGISMLLYGIINKRPPASNASLQPAAPHTAALRALALAMPLYLLYIYWFVNPHNTVTNCRFLMPAVCLLYLLTAYIAESASAGNRQAAIETEPRHSREGGNPAYHAPNPLITAIPPALMILAASCSLWSFLTPDTLEVPRNIIATLAGVASGMHKLIRPAALYWTAAIAAAAAAPLFVSGIFNKITPHSPASSPRAITAPRAIAALLTVLSLFFTFSAVTQTYNTASRTKYYWNSGMELGKVWLAVEQATAPRGGATIAVAGTDAPYPLMGFTLRNKILNINPDGCVDCPFHQYADLAPKLPGYTPPRDSQQVYKYNLIRPNKTAWIRSILKTRANIFIAFNSGGSYPQQNTWAAQTPQIFSLRKVFPEANIYEINQSRPQ